MVLFSMYENIVACEQRERDQLSVARVPSRDHSYLPPAFAEEVSAPQLSDLAGEGAPSLLMRGK